MATNQERFLKVLQDQILDSQVMFFFAAGVSKNWGYPLAKQLVDSILERMAYLQKNDPAFAAVIEASDAVPFLVEWLLSRQMEVAAAEQGTKRKVNEEKLKAKRERLARSVAQLRREGDWAAFPMELQRYWSTAEKAPARPAAPGLGEVTDWLDDYKSCLVQQILLDLEYSGQPLWPIWEEDTSSDPVASGKIGTPHIVLGRLAKEGFIREVMTVNYDHLLELGCWAVGMVRAYPPARAHQVRPFYLGESNRPGWPEVFRVIADRQDQTTTYPDRLAFRIIKLHGCIDSARARAAGCGECSWNRNCTHLSQQNLNLVITHKELLTWRNDSWARDLFVDRVRSHHMVFAGFGGADAVLHSTLRDTFAEALRLHSGSGGGESETGERQIRAQAIDVDGPQPNINLASILRAGRIGKVFSDEQLYELTKPVPANLDGLFRELYVRVVRQWINNRMTTIGTAILADWMGTKATPQNVQAESQVLLDWLSQVDDDFLYQTLPGALRWSWICRAPEVLHVDGVEPERFGRPNYYVPLHYDYRWVLALLVAYRVITEGELDHAQFEEDGWTELKADSNKRWGTLRILPILTPVSENLVRLAAFRHLTTGNQSARHRQPAARTMLLALTLGVHGNQSKMLPWNEVSASMGTIRAHVKIVDVKTLLQKRKRHELVSQLNELAGKVVQ